MKIDQFTEISVYNKFYSDQTSPDTLFPQPQAKVILPFSDAWFERMRVYGGGPEFIKIGSRVFYTKKSLLDFINKHKSVSSTAEAKEVINAI